MGKTPHLSNSQGVSLTIQAPAPKHPSRIPPGSRRTKEFRMKPFSVRKHFYVEKKGECCSVHCAAEWPGRKRKPPLENWAPVAKRQATPPLTNLRKPRWALSPGFVVLELSRNTPLS